MSEDVGQLQQLLRVRVTERHRCERSLRAALERHDEAAGVLDTLVRDLVANAAECERARKVRMTLPADPAVSDYCRAIEATLAELRCRQEAAQSRLDAAVQALIAARKRRMRVEQWLEVIEDRLREAQMRERKRHQSRRDDDQAVQYSRDLCEMPL